MAAGLSHASLLSPVQHSAGLVQTCAGTSQLFSCGTAVAWKGREKVASLRKEAETVLHVLCMGFIIRVAQCLTRLAVFLFSTACKTFPMFYRGYYASGKISLPIHWLWSWPWDSWGERPPFLPKVTLVWLKLEVQPERQISARNLLPQQNLW